MKSFEYKGFIFEPFGNIIGKDNDTRFHRLMWRANTSNPLISTVEGYSHENFYQVAGENSADIYFVPKEKVYCVPGSGGIYRIDYMETKKYIKRI